MKKGQRKYRREFVIKSRYGDSPEKHVIEVDFKKLGTSITRRLAFTTLIVNIQTELRTGVCSELTRDCIGRGAIKLDIE